MPSWTPPSSILEVSSRDFGGFGRALWGRFWRDLADFGMFFDEFWWPRPSKSNVASLHSSSKSVPSRRRRRQGGTDFELERKLASIRT